MNKVGDDLKREEAELREKQERRQRQYELAQFALKHSISLTQKVYVVYGPTVNEICGIHFGETLYWILKDEVRKIMPSDELFVYELVLSNGPECETA